MVQSRWKDRGRTTQQADRGVQVAASEGASPSRSELRGRSLAEGPGVLIDGSELDEIAICLLQVVALDLFELDDATLGDVDRLGPIHERFVERRSVTLQQAAVRGVADQDVLESVHALIRRSVRVGLDELLAGQGAQAIRHAGCALGHHQRRHRRYRETLSDHRRGLNDRALLAVKQVEPGGEQGLDGGRHAQGRQVTHRDPASVMAPQ